MFVEFRFRDLNSSEELESYAMDRFHKISKLEKDPFQISVTFSYHKTSKKVLLRLKSKRREVLAESEGEDFFACLDEATDRIMSQLKKSKDRISHRKAG
jgi:ribosomal subunit interface protein